MILQCSACGHKVRLSAENASKFAGRKVKCPNCAAAIQVPAEAPAQPSAAKPRVAEPLAAKPSAAKPASAPPAEGFPGIEIESAAPAGATGVGVLAGDESRSPLSRVKKKKKSASLPMPLLLAGGGVVAVVLLGAVTLAYLLGGFGGGSPDATGRSNLLVSGKGELTLLWPESERASSELQVDGKVMQLPASGPVSYLVPAGQRRLLLRRRGYEQVEAQIVVPEKGAVSFTPTWKQTLVADAGGGIGRFGGGGGTRGDVAGGGGGFNPDANYSSWLQDFERAKSEAAANHKDVLILFNGSDWCPYCVQLAREVLFQSRFQTLVGSEYVLVNIDFPRHAAAKSKIENPARNERLEQQFGIEGYPTVVLADAEGLPYARLGYESGGLQPFLEQIESAQSLRQARDDLKRLVETGSWQERMAYAQQFVSLMQTQDMQSFYSKTYQTWFENAREADPQNQQGYNEHFFEYIWMARLEDNARLENESGISTVAGELDRWKEKHDFRDQDRAAKLHLIAAMFMAKVKDSEAMVRYASAGAKYSTSNKQIAGLLDQLSNAGDSINVLGNGSGFVVAADGYIMTNHHVIEGEGSVAVRLPGITEPVPAKVLAQHEDHDLALIKVDHPAVANLEPIDITLAPPGRGMNIGVFGYPLASITGDEIKLTIGIISATNQNRTDGMLLLDCRVNPGNSGGPLCNTAGDVIGIVTAKSVRRSEIDDTYGMAVPAEKIVAFLKQHLPSYTPPPEPGPDAADAVPAPVQWSTVDRRISGSVIQILKMRE